MQNLKTNYFFLCFLFFYASCAVKKQKKEDFGSLYKSFKSGYTHKGDEDYCQINSENNCKLTDSQIKFQKECVESFQGETIFCIDCKILCSVGKDNLINPFNLK